MGAEVSIGSGLTIGSSVRSTTMREEEEEEDDEEDEGDIPMEYAEPVKADDEEDEDDEVDFAEVG
jgi:hypothetical protein